MGKSWGMFFRESYEGVYKERKCQAQGDVW